MFLSLGSCPVRLRRAGYWRMGTRERWAESEEEERIGKVAKFVLRTARTDPRALVSGKTRVNTGNICSTIR